RPLLLWLWPVRQKWLCHITWLVKRISHRAAMLSSRPYLQDSRGMKITCESCSAQYDLDDNRIPPSGLLMKCPACLHSFTVKKGTPAAAAPPARPPVSEGIALSELSGF